jgi:hypothetical protein
VADEPVAREPVSGRNSLLYDLALNVSAGAAFSHNQDPNQSLGLCKVMGIREDKMICLATLAACRLEVRW